MKLKSKLIMLKYKSKFFFEIKNVMFKITISAHGAGKIPVEIYKMKISIIILIGIDRDVLSRLTQFRLV